MISMADRPLTFLLGAWAAEIVLIIEIASLHVLHLTTVSYLSVFFALVILTVIAIGGFVIVMLTYRSIKSRLKLYFTPK